MTVPGIEAIISFTDVSTVDISTGLVILERSEGCWVLHSY